MKKIVSLSLALISLACFSSLALAAKPGAYVGGGLGFSKQRTKNDSLIPNSSLTTTSKPDSYGLGEQLFVGYNINEYFGVQGGFAHYAPSKAKSSIPGNTSTSKDYYLNAFDLVGKGYLPVSNSGVNLYALAGVAYVRSQTDYKQTVLGTQTTNVSTHNNKFRPKYGVGVSYDVPQSPIGAALEFSRIQGSGTVDNSSNTRAIPNADMLALQIVYKID